MITGGGKRIFLQEVAPRDGFQIEPRFIATDDKVRLIDGLSQTGLAKIEVTSFSSPRAIPALADADLVLKRIRRVPGVEYAALVPNVRGCARALEAEPDEINVVVSASETHNLANLRMSCEQSFAGIREIAALAHGRVHVSVSISTAFGCPFEGRIEPARVLEFVDRLRDIGIRRMSLCDTTGVANPAQVYALCREARGRWPQVTFTAHFHDTRAMALANALAALEAGIDRFDASLGGLGGCPFAPGASGNVCTEDLVHMFDSMGHVTGVDLTQLLELARGLPTLVGHGVPGRILQAGPATRRYAVPGADGSALDPSCQGPRSS
ncbi:MAG TPA: hydroxymethylglutaryl-CoA lyase [Steroidobacteraceae bacterium]|nr:hydroxymethylglutaryl-CoA lyase [Steroidobacteraceae bacterium]